jgi:hypothetical protein
VRGPGARVELGTTDASGCLGATGARYGIFEALVSGLVVVVVLYERVPRPDRRVRVMIGANV